MARRRRSKGDTRRRSKFVIADVDSRLGDVSDRRLDQLTRVLFHDDTPQSRQWAADQEFLVKRLGGRLLRPRGLIPRLAIRMARHHVPFTPARASLCRVHRPLDPRLVRKLMAMVEEECTARVDGLRRHRAHLECEPLVDRWLGRMDAMTGLWLDGCTLDELLDRDFSPRMGRRSENGRCEACMLAVVGGSAQMILDLTASVTARRWYMADRRPDRPAPPLLRVLESWRRLYPAETQQVVEEESERLAERIYQLRKGLGAEKEERRVARSKGTLLRAAGLGRRMQEPVGDGVVAYHPRRAGPRVSRHAAGSGHRSNRREDLRDTPEGEYRPAGEPTSRNAKTRGEASCKTSSKTGAPRGHGEEARRREARMTTATAATTQTTSKKKQSCPHNGDAAVEREEEYMDDGQEGVHEAYRDERDVNARQMHEPSRSRPKDNMTGRAEEQEGRKSTAKAAGVGTYASVAKDASTPKKTRTSGQGAQQTNVPQQRRGAKEEVGHMPQGPAAKASMRDQRSATQYPNTGSRRAFGFARLFGPRQVDDAPKPAAGSGFETANTYGQRHGADPAGSFKGPQQQQPLVGLEQARNTIERHGNGMMRPSRRQRRRKRTKNRGLRFSDTVAEVDDYSRYPGTARMDPLEREEEEEGAVSAGAHGANYQDRGCVSDSRYGGTGGEYGVDMRNYEDRDTETYQHGNVTYDTPVFGPHWTSVRRGGGGGGAYVHPMVESEPPPDPERYYTTRNGREEDGTGGFADSDDEAWSVTGTTTDSWWEEEGEGVGERGKRHSSRDLDDGYVRVGKREGVLRRLGLTV